MRSSVYPRPMFEYSTVANCCNNRFRMHIDHPHKKGLPPRPQHFDHLASNSVCHSHFEAIDRYSQKTQQKAHLDAISYRFFSFLFQICPEVRTSMYYKYSKLVKLILLESLKGAPSFAF